MTLRRQHPLRGIAAVILCAITAAACSNSGSTEPRVNTPLFDEVWDAYDRLYAFFEVGGIDWNAIGARYRDSLSVAGNDRERARLVGAMIGSLHDYHADVTTPFGAYGPAPIPYAHHYDAELVRRSYIVGAMHVTPSGAITYARLRDGTGYVYIGSFQSVNGKPWGDEIELALAALGDVPGVVFDIRDNGGGDELNAQLVAARLYDRTREYRVSRLRNGSGHGDFTAPTSTSLSPAGTQRFSGSIALITNRYNGSSAEDFVLMLRALPQAVVVGDTTLGVGSNPLRLTLSNGWTLRVPQSMQSTPDGFIYQWRGLPPHVAVPWSVNETNGEGDPYLDAAIAALTRRVQ